MSLLFEAILAQSLDARCSVQKVSKYISPLVLHETLIIAASPQQVTSSEDEFVHVEIWAHCGSAFANARIES